MANADSFTVIRVIANGMFGRVDEVLDDRLDRYARKTFEPLVPLQQGDRAKLRIRFIQEVRIQRALDPSYALPVIDFDVDADVPWYTMPIAEMTLADLVPKGDYAMEPIIAALTDVLNALEQLHAQEYVHRDLKPPNVLLHDGHWKLGDFGLALAPAEQTGRLTSQHTTWGSEKYAAPEQSLGLRKAKHTADIYAFGCILHDFFGEGAAARTPYGQHSAKGPMGPIIERCTAKDPAKRFSRVADSRAAFLDIVNEVNMPPPPVGYEEANDWATSFKELDLWDAAQFRKLIEFLVEPPVWEGPYLELIYRAADDACMRLLHVLDEELWAIFAQHYCAWAETSTFSFSYCDVVVGRLIAIFELGGASEQSYAARAIASMGSAHNRYFVMHRLFDICGNTMDDGVARRLATDIRAFSKAAAFRQCAEVIGNELTEYHPAVARALT